MRYKYHLIRSIFIITMLYGLNCRSLKEDDSYIGRLYIQLPNSKSSLSLDNKSFMYIKNDSTVVFYYVDFGPSVDRYFKVGRDTMTIGQEKYKYEAKNSELLLHGRDRGKEVLFTYSEVEELNRLEFGSQDLIEFKHPEGWIERIEIIELEEECSNIIIAKNIEYNGKLSYEVSIFENFNFSDKLSILSTGTIDMVLESLDNGRFRLLDGYYFDNRIQYSFLDKVDEIVVEGSIPASRYRSNLEIRYDLLYKDKIDTVDLSEVSIAVENFENDSISLLSKDEFYIPEVIFDGSTAVIKISSNYSEVYNDIHRIKNTNYYIMSNCNKSIKFKYENKSILMPLSFSFAESGEIINYVKAVNFSKL